MWQDSFNAAQSDEMKIKVIRTGSRFALNYPRAYYKRSNTYPIYWNVANTDQAPINCSSVNVWLSTDGGESFNQSVAENIPNTGETQITIPADITTTPNGRFKIKCSDNVFYAISYRNFFIIDSDASLTLRYSNEDQVETNLEDASLTIETSAAINNESTDVSSSGGGLFDMFMYFLFLGLFKYFIHSKSKASY